MKKLNLLCISFLISIFGFLTAPKAFAVNSTDLEFTSASLHYEGEKIAQFQDSHGATSPEERVRQAQKKLKRIFKQISTENPLNTDDFHFDYEGNYAEFYYKDDLLFTMSAEEFHANGMNANEHAADQVQDRIYNALKISLENHQPIKIIWGLAYVFLTSILFFFAIKLIYLLERKFIKSLIDHISEQASQASKLFKIYDFNKTDIYKTLTTLMSMVSFVLVLITIYFYILVVFSFLPWTKGWSDKIFLMVKDPLIMIFNQLVNYLPGLFFIAVIIFLIRLLLKVVKLFFDAVEAGRFKIEGFHQEWATPTYQIVRILLCVLGFVMCFPHIPGSESAAFKGISVFLGALVSFGSSSAVSNMIAGIVITYMRPFKVGDRVKVSDTIGDITEKGLLVTRIKTIKNVEITVPNSMMLSSHIINYSTLAKTEKLILNVKVTMAYDVPWRKIHDILLGAANSCPEVLKDPKPFIFQTNFNDFCVSYELNAYTNQPNKMDDIYSYLHQTIQDGFHENEISMVTPANILIRDGVSNYKISQSVE